MTSETVRGEETLSQHEDDGGEDRNFEIDGGEGHSDDERDNLTSTRESAPLLRSDEREGDIEADDMETASTKGSGRRYRRATVIAASILSIMALVVLVLAFVTPSAAREYAKQATSVELKSLKLESLTDDGFKMHIFASTHIDPSKVSNGFVRGVGTIGAWLVGSVSVTVPRILLTLPKMHGSVVANASVLDPVKISLKKNTDHTIDMVSLIIPGDLEVIKGLAYRYADGNIESLLVRANADVNVKKGFLGFGESSVQQDVLLQSSADAPHCNISDFSFHDVKDGGVTQLAASVNAVIDNPFNVEMQLPELNWALRLPGCTEKERLTLAYATTSSVTVMAGLPVEVNAEAIVSSLPQNFFSVCPKSDISPIDDFLASYLEGRSASVYVSGADSSTVPKWLSSFLSELEIPVGIPETHSDGDLIRDFSLSDVQLQLPAPSATPGSEDALALISATIEAKIMLPKEVNITVDLNKLKARTTLSYDSKHFANLNVHNWTPASSHFEDDGSVIVSSRVEKVPLDVTNNGVFASVATKVLFGSKVDFGINGTADIGVATGLGQFVLRKIPAHGRVMINGIPSLGSLHPKLEYLDVLDTTKTSLSVELVAELVNPTMYEAKIPYLEMRFSYRDFVLGSMTICDYYVKAGRNHIPAVVKFSPFELGGTDSVSNGIDMIGLYLSELGPNLTISAFEASIPSMPLLSKAMSRLQFTIPLPQLPREQNIIVASNECPEQSRQGSDFLKAATMHLFTSSADFVIRNPLPRTSITVDKLNATASYHGGELGQIYYDSPLVIKQGSAGYTFTPRLPVSFNIGSDSYDALRRALGGVLHVNGTAFCDVRIGEFVMKNVLYRGQGLGAKVSVSKILKVKPKVRLT